MPAARSSTTRATTSAPVTAIAARTSPLVASGSIVNGSEAYTGPASSASTSWKTVAAVSVSPAITARWTGAAPRYAGRSEKCRFTQPSRGASRAGRGAGAVGDDHPEVRLERGDLRGHGLVDPGRLDDRHPSSAADLCDRGRRQDALPALRGRGTGEHRDDLVVGRREAAEGGDGRSGAAGDDETHGVHRPMCAGPGGNRGPRVRTVGSTSNRGRQHVRRHHVHQPLRRSSIQKVALVVGIVFLLVGDRRVRPGTHHGRPRRRRARLDGDAARGLPGVGPAQHRAPAVRRRRAARRQPRDGLPDVPRQSAASSTSSCGCTACSPRARCPVRTSCR